MNVALSGQQLTVFAILVAAVALLLSRRIRADLIAILVILSLAYFGVLKSDEALAGFGSEPAIVMLSTFVLGAALRETGVLDQLGSLIGHAGGASHPRLLGALLSAAALLSAVSQRVTSTTLLVPSALQVCRQRGVAPSQVLLPMLHGAALGGPITLMGVPALLIASGVLTRAGRPPLGMFSIAPVALALTAVGILFCVLLARRLLPARGGEAAFGPLDHGEYVTELTICPESAFVGQSVADLERANTFRVFVTGWLRGGRPVRAPFGERPLEAGDVLLVRTTPEEIVAIQRESGVELRPVVQHRPEPAKRDGHLEDEDRADADPEAFAAKLAQAIVAPGSDLAGRSLSDLDFRRRYGAVVVGLWRRRGWLSEELARIRLRPGDVLVIHGDEEALARVAGDPGFLMMVPVVGEHRLRHRARLAIGILVATVAVAGSGLLSIGIASLAGGAAMVLTGCLRPRQAYRAIDARAYVFLAGAIPLGEALEKSGAAQVVAGWLQLGLGGLAGSPLVVLLVLFAVGGLATQLLSDVATVAVFAPVAAALAEALGRPPEAFVVCLALAAVTTILTPFAHPSAQLVAGPGRYRPADFVRVGLPLAVLSALVVAVGTQLLGPA
jgi:di/tricarboxylate transporter